MLNGGGDLKHVHWWKDRNCVFWKDYYGNVSFKNTPLHKTYAFLIFRISKLF